MPFYDVEVFKRLGSEGWENKYTVTAADMNAVRRAWGEFATYERAIHATNVLIDYIRISSHVEGDNEYITIPVNANGLRFIAGGQLPLWNVVRVDFTHAAFGAPGRKYYRLPLAEGDTEDGLITGALASAIDTPLGVMFTGLANLDVTLSDGTLEAVTGWSISNRVQYRKLTRSRRKKASGGLVTGPS